MSFTSLIGEVRAEIEGRKEGMQRLVATNPNKAYAELNQIVSALSRKHGVLLQLHFPDTSKIRMSIPTLVRI